LFAALAFNRFHYNTPLHYKSKDREEHAEKSRRGAARIRSLTALAAAALREEAALDRRTFDPWGLARLTAGVFGGMCAAYFVLWSGVWGRWLWSLTIGLVVGFLTVEILAGARNGNNETT
jgi:hypothetical protein